MIVRLQEDIHAGGIMKYKKKLRKRDRKHLQWQCGKDGQNEMQGRTSQPEWKERLLKEKKRNLGKKLSNYRNVLRRYRQYRSMKNPKRKWEE